MEDYGKEVIVDLHECNPEKFNRVSISEFFQKMCDRLDMEQCDLHFWDYEDEHEEYEKAPDHLKGTSAIQFISTSNITIHTLDVLKKVFLNVFSCKDFNTSMVVETSKNFFEGEVVNLKELRRI